MGSLTFLTKYNLALFNGLQITFFLCLIIWSSGIIVGGSLGALGAAYPQVIGRTLEYISYVVRAIPILVLLFWFHYPFQAFFDITLHPFITAAISISLVNISLTSDLVRGILLKFPVGYVESAQICGLTWQQTLLHIKLPIILRQLIPQILNLKIQMLHMTLFAGLISVQEIFRVAQRINAIEYKPIEVYTGMTLFFLLICLPVSALASWLEARTNKKFIALT